MMNMDSPVIIRCAGAPAPSRLTGLYLASYDLEARGGRGEADWTPDPTAALVFLSFKGAFNCWRATSVTAPVRDDGKPNRPLTSYSVRFEDAPVILSASYVPRSRP